MFTTARSPESGPVLVERQAPFLATKLGLLNWKHRPLGVSSVCKDTVI